MPVEPQRNIFAQMQAGPAPIELSQFGVPQMGLGQDTTGGIAFPELPTNLLSPGEMGAFLGGGPFQSNSVLGNFLRPGPLSAGAGLESGFPERFNRMF